MLLHISDDVSLKKEDVLFILDYRTLKKDSSVLNFFKNSAVPKIKRTEEKHIKSIVITGGKSGTEVYFSTCSPLTLARRVNNDKQLTRTAL